jgi:hypothetical protein
MSDEILMNVQCVIVIVIVIVSVSVSVMLVATRIELLMP